MYSYLSCRCMLLYLSIYLCMYVYVWASMIAVVPKISDDTGQARYQIHCASTTPHRCLYLQRLVLPLPLRILSPFPNEGSMITVVTKTSDEKRQRRYTLSLLSLCNPPASCLLSGCRLADLGRHHPLYICMYGHHT